MTFSPVTIGGPPAGPAGAGEPPVPSLDGKTGAVSIPRADSPKSGQANLQQAVTAYVSNPANRAVLEKVFKDFDPKEFRFGGAQQQNVALLVNYLLSAKLLSYDDKIISGTMPGGGELKVADLQSYVAAKLAPKAGAAPVVADGVDKAAPAPVDKPMATSVLPPPPASVADKDLAAGAKTAQHALDDNPAQFGAGVHGFKTPEERAPLFDTMLANATPEQLADLQKKLSLIKPASLVPELEHAIALRTAQLPGGALEGITSPEVVGKYRDFVCSKDSDKRMKELGITPADIHAWLTAPPGTAPPASIAKAIASMQNGDGKTSLVPEVNVMLKLFPLYVEQMKTRTAEDPKIQDQIGWATDVNKHIGGYAQKNRIAWGHRMEGEARFQEKQAKVHTDKAIALRAAGKYTEAANEDALAGKCKENAYTQRKAGATALGSEAEAIDAQIAKMGDRAPPWLRTKSTELNAGAASYAAKLGDADATAVEENFVAANAMVEGGGIVGAPTKLPPALGDHAPHGKEPGGAQFYLGKAKAFDPNASTNPDFIAAESTTATVTKTHAEKYLRFNGYPPDPPKAGEAPKPPVVTDDTKVLLATDVKVTMTLRDNVTTQIAALESKPHLSADEKVQLKGLCEQEKQYALQIAGWKKDADETIAGYPQGITDQKKRADAVNSLIGQVSGLDEEIKGKEAELAAAKKDAEATFAGPRDKKLYASLQTIVADRKAKRDTAAASLITARAARDAGAKAMPSADAMNTMSFVTYGVIFDSNPNAKLNAAGQGLGPDVAMLLAPGMHAATVEKDRLLPPKADVPKLKPDEQLIAGDIALSDAAFQGSAAKLLMGKGVVMPGAAAVKAKDDAIASQDYAQAVHAALPADAKGSTVKSDFGVALIKTGAQLSVDIARIDPPASGKVLDTARINTQGYKGNEPLHNELVDVVYSAGATRSMILMTRDKQLGPGGVVENEGSESLKLAQTIGAEYSGADYTSDTRTHAAATVAEIASWPEKAKKAMEEYKLRAAAARDEQKAEILYNEISAINTTESGISVMVDVAVFGATLGLFSFGDLREDYYKDRLDDRMKGIDDAYTREIAGYDAMEKYIDESIRTGTYSQAMGVLQNFSAPRPKDGPSQAAQMSAYVAKFGITGVDVPALNTFCIFSNTLRPFLDDKSIDGGAMLATATHWQGSTNSTQDRYLGEAQILNADMADSWYGKYGTLVVSGGELVVGTILTAGIADAVEGTAAFARIAGAIKRIQGVSAALELAAAAQKAAPFIYRLAEAYVILEGQDLINEHIGGNLFSSKSSSGKLFALSTQLVGARASNAVFKATKLAEQLALPGFQLLADQLVIPNWPGLSKEDQEMWHKIIKYSVPLLGTMHGHFASAAEAHAGVTEGVHKFNENLPETHRLSEPQTKALADQVYEFQGKAKPSAGDFNLHEARIREIMGKSGAPSEAINAFVLQEAKAFVASQQKTTWGEAHPPTIEEAQALTAKVAAELQAAQPGMPHEVAIQQAHDIVLDKLQAAMPSYKTPTAEQKKYAAAIDEVARATSQIANDGVIAGAAVKGLPLSEGAKALVLEAAKAQSAALRAKEAPTPEATRAALAETKAKLTAELAKSMPHEKAAALAEQTTERLALIGAEQSAERLAMVVSQGRPTAALRAQAFELQAAKLGVPQETISKRTTEIYADARAGELAARITSPEGKAAEVKAALIEQIGAFEAAEVAGKKPNLGELASSIEKKLVAIGVDATQARAAAKAATGELITHRALSEGAGAAPGLAGKSGLTTPAAERAAFEAQGKALAEANAGTPPLYSASEMHEMQSGLAKQLVSTHAGALIEARTKALGRAMTTEGQFACVKEAAAEVGKTLEGAAGAEGVSATRLVAEMAYDSALNEMASTPEGRKLLADETKTKEVEAKALARAKALGADAAAVREIAKERDVALHEAPSEVTSVKVPGDGAVHKPLAVKALSAAEGAQIVDKANFSADRPEPRKYAKFTAEAAKNMGLEPRHSFTADGATYHVSEPFSLGDGRLAVIAFVERVVDGKIVIEERTFYRSNSQASWRVMPESSNDAHYGKGGGEQTAQLPMAVSGALHQLSAGELHVLPSAQGTTEPTSTELQALAKVRSANPEAVIDEAEFVRQYRAESAFFGSVDHAPYISMAFLNEHTVPGAGKAPVSKEFASTGKLETLKKGKKVADPKSMALAPAESRPDFSKPPVETYTYTNERYADFNGGDPTVRIRIYESRDGALRYALAEDASGRVSIAGIETKDGTVTSFGARKVYVEPHDRDAPLFEYGDQIAKGYGESKEEGYVSNWKYVSEVPEIVMFYHEQGLVPPGVSEAAFRERLAEIGVEPKASYKAERAPIGPAPAKVPELVARLDARAVGAEATATDPKASPADKKAAWAEKRSLSLIKAAPAETAELATQVVEHLQPWPNETPAHFAERKSATLETLSDMLPVQGEADAAKLAKAHEAVVTFREAQLAALDTVTEGPRGLAGALAQSGEHFSPADMRDGVTALNLAHDRAPALLEKLNAAKTPVEKAAAFREILENNRALDAKVAKPKGDAAAPIPEAAPALAAEAPAFAKVELKRPKPNELTAESEHGEVKARETRTNFVFTFPEGMPVAQRAHFAEAMLASMGFGEVQAKVLAKVAAETKANAEGRTFIDRPLRAIDGAGRTAVREGKAPILEGVIGIDRAAIMDPEGGGYSGVEQPLRQIYKSLTGSETPSNPYEGKCSVTCESMQGAFAAEGVYLPVNNFADSHRWMSAPGSPERILDPTFGQFLKTAGPELVHGGNAEHVLKMYEPFYGTYGEMQTRVLEAAKLGLVDGQPEGFSKLAPEAQQKWAQEFLEKNWGIKGAHPDGSLALSEKVVPFKDAVQRPEGYVHPADREAALRTTGVDNAPGEIAAPASKTLSPEVAKDAAVIALLAAYPEAKGIIAAKGIALAEVMFRKQTLLKAVASPEFFAWAEAHPEVAARMFELHQKRDVDIAAIVEKNGLSAAQHTATLFTEFPSEAVRAYLNGPEGAAHAVALKTPEGLAAARASLKATAGDIVRVLSDGTVLKRIGPEGVRPAPSPEVMAAAAKRAGVDPAVLADPTAHPKEMQAIVKQVRSEMTPEARAAFDLQMEARSFLGNAGYEKLVAEGVAQPELGQGKAAWENWQKARAALQGKPLTLDGCIAAYGDMMGGESHAALRKTGANEQLGFGTGAADLHHALNAEQLKAVRENPDLELEVLPRYASDSADVAARVRVNFKAHDAAGVEIKARMNTVLERAEADLKAGKDPVAIAAQLEHDLVSIQPFADGNHRFARLVAGELLERAGLPPLSLGRESPLFMDAAAVAKVMHHSLAEGVKDAAGRPAKEVAAVTAKPAEAKPVEVKTAAALPATPETQIARKAAIDFSGEYTPEQSLALEKFQRGEKLTTAESKSLEAAYEHNKGDADFVKSGIASFEDFKSAMHTDTAGLPRTSAEIQHALFEVARVRAEQLIAEPGAKFMEARVHELIAQGTPDAAAQLDMLASIYAQGAVPGMLARDAVRYKLALEHLIKSPPAENFAAIRDGLQQANGIAVTDPASAARLRVGIIGIAAASQEHGIALGVNDKSHAAAYRFADDHLPPAMAWPTHVAMIDGVPTPVMATRVVDADGAMLVSHTTENGATEFVKVPADKLSLIEPHEAGPGVPIASESATTGATRQGYVLGKSGGRELVWNETARAFELTDKGDFRPTAHGKEAINLIGSDTHLRYESYRSNVEITTARLPAPEQATLAAEFHRTTIAAEAYAALPQAEQSKVWKEFLQHKLDASVGAGRSPEEQMLMMQVFSSRGSFADVTQFSAMVHAYFGAEPAPAALIRLTTADGLIQFYKDTCGPTDVQMMLVAAFPLDALSYVAGGREAIIAQQNDFMKQINVGTDLRTADLGALPGAGAGRVAGMPVIDSPGASAAVNGSTVNQARAWLNQHLAGRLGTSYEPVFAGEYHATGLPTAKGLQSVNEELWSAVGKGSKTGPSEGVFAMIEWTDANGLRNGGHWVQITRAYEKALAPGESGPPERFYVIRDPWTGKTFDTKASQLFKEGGGGVLDGRGELTSFLRRELPLVTEGRKAFAGDAQWGEAFALDFASARAMALDPATHEQGTLRQRALATLTRESPEVAREALNAMRRAGTAEELTAVQHILDGAVSPHEKAEALKAIAPPTGTLTASVVPVIVRAGDPLARTPLAADPITARREAIDYGGDYTPEQNAAMDKAKSGAPLTAADEAHLAAAFEHNKNDPDYVSSGIATYADFVDVLQSRPVAAVTDPSLIGTEIALGAEAAKAAGAPAKDSAPAAVEFRAQADINTDAFAEVAAKSKISPAGAKELYEIAGADKPDPVTKGEPAEAKVPLTERAYEQVIRQPGVRAYRMQGELLNLGGLNGVLGGPGANLIYGKMTEIIMKHMDAIGVTARLCRENGPTFSVTLMGEHFPPEAIAKAMAEANAEIATYIAQHEPITYVDSENVKHVIALEDVVHPKHLEEASFNGTGVAFGVAEIVPRPGASKEERLAEIFNAADESLEINKRALGRAEDPGKRGATPDIERGAVISGKVPPMEPGHTPPPARAERFLSDVEFRREAFVKRALELNPKLARADALKLFREAKGESIDAVTTLGKPTGRAETMLRMMDWLTTHPEDRAYYAEVDIRNLSGLNAVLSRDEANGVFKTIATIVREELLAQSREIDPTRHGGDEFGSTIVSHELSHEDVTAALARAQKRIDGYAESTKIKLQPSGKVITLAEIIHPKHFDDKSYYGTGITYGVAEIRPPKEGEAAMKSVESIFDSAAIQVEINKKNKKAAAVPAAKLGGA